jgi:hypothetical protein
MDAASFFSLAVNESSIATSGEQTASAIRKREIDVRRMVVTSLPPHGNFGFYYEPDPEMPCEPATASLMLCQARGVPEGGPTKIVAERGVTTRIANFAKSCYTRSRRQ